MGYYLMFIPFLSSLVLCLIVLILFHVLIHRIMPAKQGLLSTKISEKIRNAIDPTFLASKMENIDFESELSPIIDHKLDHLINQFKPMIPMGEILLSGSLAQRLKEKIKIEVLNAVPEIKSHMISKIFSTINLNQCIEEQLQKVQWVEIINAELKEERNKLLLLSALVGFVLGLFNLALFFFLS